MNQQIIFKNHINKRAETFLDNSNFSKEENEWMKQHNMNPNDYMEADYL